LNLIVERVSWLCTNIDIVLADAMQS